MGEYAKYGNRQIKIGTCEDMYYLRFDQRRKVRPEDGSVDPVRDAHSLRFRFPFPDEDGISPGEFADHDRSIETDLDAPADVEHGYDLAASNRDGRGPVKCGAGKVAISQQRLVTGEDGKDWLVLICACTVCRRAWRLPTLRDALPVIGWLHDEARALLELETSTDVSYLAHAERAAFLAEVFARIIAGYREQGGES